MKQIFLGIALLFSTLYAATKEEPDVKKISEAMGFLIAKNLEDLGLKLDVDLVMKGLKEAQAGKASPLSEEECIAAIGKIQENYLKETGEKNLTQANQFLADNAKRSGIQQLEQGKLQYKVEENGNGAIVEAHNSPLITYTGKYLDGTVFGMSEEAEVVSLDSTIEGFSKGLVGMKEGEKRTLFIHPDLGYQSTGMLLPNSLLIFEVKVLKADGSSNQTPALKELSKELSPETDQVKR